MSVEVTRSHVCVAPWINHAAVGLVSADSIVESGGVVVRVGCSRPTIQGIVSIGKLPAVRKNSTGKISDRIPCIGSDTPEGVGEAGWPTKSVSGMQRGLTQGVRRLGVATNRIVREVYRRGRRGASTNRRLDWTLTGIVGVFYLFA